MGTRGNGGGNGEGNGEGNGDTTGHTSESILLRWLHNESGLFCTSGQSQEPVDHPDWDL